MFVRAAQTIHVSHGIRIILAELFEDLGVCVFQCVLCMFYVHFRCDSWPVHLTCYLPSIL